MTASLSVPERQIGLLISVLLALMGLVMAAVAATGCPCMGLWHSGLALA